MKQTEKRLTAKLGALIVTAATAACAPAIDMQFMKELVAIPSASADIPQVNRAMLFMKDYLEKRGVWCVTEKHPDGHEILFAATRPGKVQDFIIASHLDVVPASVPGQYEMKIDGEKVVGRGVNDCKGRSVAVAEMLVRLNGKVSVGCIFGADEELGGGMTTWMVTERGYRPRRMAIVTDAGWGSVYYAHKGQCMVRIKAKGRGGHSSAPWKCDDSITRLVRAYLKIRETWDARHPPRDDKWWDVLTPTVVRSEGEALNRIPGEVSMVLNLRSVNPGAKDELFAVIREVCDLDAELVRYSPPVSSDPDNPLMRGIRSALSEAYGVEVVFARMFAATDARCFTTCGVPIAIIGSKGGGSHGDDEWADLSTCDLMAEGLERFLSSPDKYADGAPR